MADQANMEVDVESAIEKALENICGVFPERECSYFKGGPSFQAVKDKIDESGIDWIDKPVDFFIFLVEMERATAEHLLDRAAEVVQAQAEELEKCKETITALQAEHTALQAEHRTAGWVRGMLQSGEVQGKSPTKFK